MANGVKRNGSHPDVYSEVIGSVMTCPLIADGTPTITATGLPLSAVVLAGHELLPGHSRNSSGTSHSAGSGSASGYGSLASQSQHSRQSSSGELGHFRSVRRFSRARASESRFGSRCTRL